VQKLDAGLLGTDQRIEARSFFVSARCRIERNRRVLAGRKPDRLSTGRDGNDKKASGDPTAAIMCLLRRLDII
jgi:hypothetical protein